MNNKETNNEYHDPDYPENPVCIKEEKRSQQETEEKIKAIIRKEFTNELHVRESEVMLIDQRMAKARRYLHQIRYHLVNSYYSDPKLSLTGSQIEDDISAQTRAKAQVAALLRESQPQIHPSVLKLLGKKSVDIEEILTTRSQRKRSRKNYSAMVNPKNYTTAAGETQTLRPHTSKPHNTVPPEEPSTSRVKKVPKHLTPKVENVLKLDEITRNKIKHRYRIIIGNTSKYAPAAGRADRSTHKWLLYVRGPAGTDVARVLAAASVRLHPSYAPHHIVRLEKPPFHVSRRGWGEFPARVELHFRLPEVNRPAAVEHTIKLDRNYTGLQTLGAETIVDVWLYSTPDMLEFEYKDEAEAEAPAPDRVQVKSEPEPAPRPDPEPAPAGIKLEPPEPLEPADADSWLDFFARDTTELNVDEMLVIHARPPPAAPDPPSDRPDVANGDDEPAAPDEPPPVAPSPARKRIVKYVDPTTRKIYYLEMDRSLDISKVQEIVIDSKEGPRTAKIGPVESNGLRKVRRKKSGVSVLKPEVRGRASADGAECAAELGHIANDHCYAGGEWLPRPAPRPPPRDPASALVALEATVARFSCERVVVNYLLKKMPLINVEAADLDFLQDFPFVVENEQKYWKLDFAKRRNIEWSRAKLINRILAARFKSEPGRVWRTKQILVYSRLHGFYPVRPDVPGDDDVADAPAPPADLASLSLFRESRYPPVADAALDVSDDEEVDVVGAGRGDARPGAAPGEGLEGLEVLPAGADERLHHAFVERAAADIGIELRLEDIGSGYCYSAVHLVLVSALRSFAEDLVRGALAARYAPDRNNTVWLGARRAAEAVIRPAHVWAAAADARGAGRLRLLSRAALAVRPATQTPL
ncbi:uncharacterized protein LOC121737634 [Aricia agestis]|uniref:uncharacterized protein LOC121737634 n=1 Tax=Aricia agestis TaxID=91739 RepID=UPI001C208216|nr:uncharacterized protein LOC121737634 [Aricia agestis]